MEMKNLLATTALAGALAAHPALAGPSAKFAATWDSSGPNIASVAEIIDATADSYILNENDGYYLTTIKVPQDKELMVGVSAEIGLTTDTSVRGKDGGSAKAIAGARAYVIVTATPVGGGLPTEAVPGSVMLSERVQELNATLGGVIEECTDYTGGTDINGLNPGDEGYIDTPDGTLDVDLECVVSDEEIGLMLDTMAAHHFNFILPNMDAGEYAIKAHFFTAADAGVDIDEVSVSEGGTVSASVYAEAFVGKTMVTVQQVRAVAGSLADVDIAE